jgi:S1-C subfamily serine protease
MKQRLLPLLGFILLHGATAAQDDIPLLRPEEKQAVDEQNDEFNQSLTPALTEAAKSTVRVWAGKRRLAYGTVIGDGTKILTKWSEVANGGGTLRVEAAGGQVRPVRISGVYEDEDVAVLEQTGSPLVPVKWFAETPQLGSFLAAPQPDGKLAAFGVVSVLERNLRDTDKAFLGVRGAQDYDGPGVMIDEVTPKTGAADAGLKPGDIIVKVGERTISGLLELKNSLVGVAPGKSIELSVRKGKQESKVNVVLGNRPNLPNFLGDRLQQMERMGTTPSRVRDSFSSAIQTDMRLNAILVGGPVANLKGQVVGITLARGDRTKSFVMPADAVKKLLEKEPTDPSLAQVRKEEVFPELPVGREMPHGNARPVNPDRLRRHLSEMQRLMDHMREEMESIEPEPR